MSDLRGFTALSAKLSPDTLTAIVNHYFEEMTKIIGHYGGTVIEFLGDGIFVVFGTPNDDENHADHAVSCAVEIQNTMKSVNEWNAQRLKSRRSFSRHPNKVLCLKELRVP